MQRSSHHPIVQVDIVKHIATTESTAHYTQFPAQHCVPRVACSTMYDACLLETPLSMQALLRKECGLDVAVGPAQLATSAYWTLMGASAFVAGKLGTTVTHVLQQHSMLHMTKVCD